MNQDNQPTPAPSCEAELITRAQRGEEKAFEALFHAYKQRVYRLCLRMIGNVAEAEELTQEAFLTLFRKIHTFRGESAFSTWLLRISMNTVLMRMRKKTPTEIPLESGTDNEESEQPQREYGSPDLGLEGVVDRVCLELAIAKLPRGYRQMFVLHDILGCEHHEIAETLGCSIGNCKSQLHKARMRLRKLLRPLLRNDRQRRAATTGSTACTVLT